MAVLETDGGMGVQGFDLAYDSKGRPKSDYRTASAPLNGMSNFIVVTDMFEY